MSGPQCSQASHYRNTASSISISQLRPILSSMLGSSGGSVGFGKWFGKPQCMIGVREGNTDTPLAHVPECWRANPRSQNPSWGMCYSQITGLLRNPRPRTASRKPTRVISRLPYTQLHFVTSSPRHFPYQSGSFEQHQSTHNLAYEFSDCLGYPAAYWPQRLSDTRSSFHLPGGQS